MLIKKWLCTTYAFPLRGIDPKPQRKFIQELYLFFAVALEYLAFIQEEVNPLTGIKGLLSNEHITALALIHKAKNEDVTAYKALMDSTYGTIKQSIEVTQGETPIFKQLDIDVIN